MNVLLVSSSSELSRHVLSALAGPDVLTHTEVRSPLRALALLDDDEGETFDVVLADNDTQPTGGFYLSRELKARARMGRDVPPVILILAREQDEYLARWSEADVWIIKPVDPFDLAEAVEAVAARRPVPQLPGVFTYAERGAIGGPGKAEELPPPAPVDGL